MGQPINKQIGKISPYGKAQMEFLRTNPSAVKLSTFLCISMHQGTGDEAYPSIRTIARLINRSERNVKQAISDLEDEGWISKRKSKSGNNIYTCNYVFIEGKQFNDRAITIEQEEEVDQPVINRSHNSDQPIPQTVINRSPDSDQPVTLKQQYNNNKTKIKHDMETDIQEEKLPIPNQEKDHPFIIQKNCYEVLQKLFKTSDPHYFDKIITLSGGDPQTIKEKYNLLVASDYRKSRGYNVTPKGLSVSWYKLDNAPKNKKVEYFTEEPEGFYDTLNEQQKKVYEEMQEYRKIPVDIEAIFGT